MFGFKIEILLIATFIKKYQINLEVVTRKLYSTCFGQYNDVVVLVQLKDESHLIGGRRAPFGRVGNYIRKQV